MWEDDFILRQLNRFALGVAEVVAGRDVEELDDLAEDVESLLGGPVELFSSMNSAALLGLFPTDDHQAMRRAIALAIALAKRAVAADDDQLRARALMLLDHARPSRTDLGEAEMKALRDVLRGQLDEGLRVH